jgi:hypothetical protein
MSWTGEYQASLEGRSWADDVITETAACDCHPDKTWLRHVPTGVLIYHWGRSDADTLHHLGEILHAHGVITLEHRDAAVEAARKSPPA